MRISVVSDLHLEFSDMDIKNTNNCDVLILSGDIMVAETLYDYPETSALSDIEIGKDINSRKEKAQQFRDFLKRASLQFPHVIYVAGNHEFYHGRWVGSIQTLRNECSKFSNIHFLEMDSITVDDITFVGGTLWTDMNKGDPLTLHAARDLMNDFRKIRNDELGFRRLSPGDTVLRHRKTLQYIKHVVDNDPTKKYVVVGHHSPSWQSCHEYYKDDTVINGCYHSELSEFILDHSQIKLWTHGHVHHTFDYKIGETRIICNPRGYHAHGYNEDTGWNPDLVVEV